MRISEAVDFIAALSRQETDDLSAIEADELMDEMDVSEELRALVVADVVGGQYQCADCFPDGCGEFGEEHAEEHNATGREISLANWGQHPSAWAGFVRKERYASDAWDQPVSRIALIHEIAKATKEVSHNDLGTIDLSHDLGIKDLTSPFGDEF
jgi:hypothetical protein